MFFERALTCFSIKPNNDVDSQRTFINKSTLSDEKVFVLCSDNNSFGFVIRDNNNNLVGGWALSETNISESINQYGWVHYAMSFNGEIACTGGTGTGMTVQVQTGGTYVKERTITGYYQENYTGDIFLSPVQDRDELYNGTDITGCTFSSTTQKWTKATHGLSAGDIIIIEVRDMILVKRAYIVII